VSRSSDSQLDGAVSAQLEHIENLKKEIARQRAVNSALKETVEKERRKDVPDPIQLKLSMDQVALELRKTEAKLWMMRLFDDFGSNRIESMESRVQNAQLLALQVRNTRQEIANLKRGKRQITSPAELGFLNSEQVRYEEVLAGLVSRGQSLAERVKVLTRELTMRGLEIPKL
jgi:hypothetical protein